MRSLFAWFGNRNIYSGVGAARSLVEEDGTSLHAPPTLPGWRLCLLQAQSVLGKAGWGRSLTAVLVGGYVLLIVRLYSMRQVRWGTVLGVRTAIVLPFLLVVPPAVYGVVAWNWGAWLGPDGVSAGSASLCARFSRQRCALFCRACVAAVTIVAALILLYAVYTQCRRYGDYRRAASRYHEYLQSPPQPEEADVPQLPVRLITYNVFVRPPGVAGQRGNDQKDQRLRLLLPRLANYDVVCLQEMFDAFSTRRAALAQAATVFGLRFSTYLPRNLWMYPPRVIDGGVSILSRYPIVASDYWHYRHVVRGTVDSFVGKGVLYARILLPTREQHNRHRRTFLHVFSTHMQAGDRPGYQPETLHANTRLQQAEEMRDFILRCIADDEGNGAVAITGDFNINARISRDDGHESQWYRQLMQRLQALSKTDDGAHRSLHLADLLRQSFGEHPITDDAKCIDYLLFDARDSGIRAAVHGPNAVRIEPFHVPPEEMGPDTTIRYDGLSDHDAVAGTLWHTL